MTDLIEIQATIERKDPALPRFVVVPTRAIAALYLSGTTVVEGTVNGVTFGRQTIKPWDAERWFLTITEALCRRASIDTGDAVQVAFRVAPESMPAELERALRDHPAAAKAYESLTPAQRRMLREEILTAKSPATQYRRALKRLHPAALED